MDISCRFNMHVINTRIKSKTAEWPNQNQKPNNHLI